MSRYNTHTLADVRQYVYDEVLGGRSDTKAQNIADRIIEEAHYEIASFRNWHFYNTTNRSTLNRAITSGIANATAAYTSGSTTVQLSTGVTELSGVNLSGQFFQSDADDTLYTIQSHGVSGGGVTITLESEYPYVGSTSAASGFTIYQTVIELPNDMDTMMLPWEDNFQSPLQHISYPEMLGHQRTYGVYLGGPFFYSLGPNPVTHKESIHIWPAPTIQQTIDIAYYRLPTIPTVSTDVIDFPDEHIGVLWKALDWLGARYIKLGENPQERAVLTNQRYGLFIASLKRWARKDKRTTDLGYVGQAGSTSKFVDIRLAPVNV